MDPLTRRPFCCWKSNWMVSSSNSKLYVMLCTLEVAFDLLLVSLNGALCPLRWCQAAATHASFPIREAPSTAASTETSQLVHYGLIFFSYFNFFLLLMFSISFGLFFYIVLTFSIFYLLYVVVNKSIFLSKIHDFLIYEHLFEMC